MRASRVLTSLLAIILAALPARTGAEGPGRILSIAKSEFEAARLGRRGLDRLMEKDGRVYIVVTPAEMGALSARRIAYAVEPDRGPALSADGGINGAYHSTLEMETDMRLLERDHPGRALVVEIGESLEGRKILALKISDNAARSEAEPAVLFLGCHHAREWISVEVPFLFGRYLLEHYDLDQEVRDLVDASEIWIVPIVNPDGLEYSIHVYRYWRKNRRANADGTFGVDINRNYGYRWGYDDIGSSGNPASEVFRGPAPFSEPETAAVRGLFTGRDFRAVVSYHSYSRVILYPWGYTAAPAPRDAELRSVAETMSGLIASVGGTVYDAGQASTSSIRPTATRSTGPTASPGPPRSRSSSRLWTSTAEGSSTTSRRSGASSPRTSRPCSISPDTPSTTLCPSGGATPCSRSEGGVPSRRRTGPSRQRSPSAFGSPRRGCGRPRGCERIGPARTEGGPP